MRGGEYTNNIIDLFKTSATSGVKKGAKNILRNSAKIALTGKYSSSYSQPENLKTFRGANINEELMNLNNKFVKQAGESLNALNKKYQYRQKIRNLINPQIHFSYNNSMSTNSHVYRQLMAEQSPPTRKNFGNIQKRLYSPIIKYATNTTRKYKNITKQALANRFPFMSPSMPITSKERSVQMEGGVKRPASSLNNRNKTVKRARYNNNSSSNQGTNTINNTTNNEEIELNLNSNVANAIRAAILQLKSTRKVHFPNNINNTVKRPSHFNKTFMQELTNMGATEEQINTVKTAYQNNMKKAPYPPIYTLTAQHAAHKFAKFIEKIDNVTFVPEFAYQDLIHVFGRIENLPYKIATKKMMMKRAYKLLAFRAREPNNNTTKQKVLLLTPEQDAKLKSIMKLNPTNFN